MGFPDGGSGKELACQSRLDEDTRVQSLSWEDPLEAWQPTAGSCLENPHETEEPGGPWGCKASDSTEVA